MYVTIMHIFRLLFHGAVRHRPICTVLLLFIIQLGAAAAEVPTGRRPETYWSDAKSIALANAITRDDLKEIDKLIADGADVNARGKDDATPLLWAVARRKSRAFERLLQHGANPNSRYPYYGSLLHFFARAENSSQWLRLALEHKGDPNLVPVGEWKTPLFGAVSSRRKDSLELLIKAGADLNHRDNHRETAMLFAAAMNWFDSVFYLLEAGADYRPRNDYSQDVRYEIIDTTVDPDHELAKWRERAVDWLVGHGADFREAEDRIGRILGTRDETRRWEREQQERARRWTNTEPRDARGYRLRAAGWRIQKDFDKALADYTEAIRLDPENGGAFRQRAEVRWCLSAKALLQHEPHKPQLSRAIEDDGAAIERDPNDAEAYLHRADLLVSDDQYDKAMSDLDQAIRLDGKFAKAYVERGNRRSLQATFDYIARSGSHRGNAERWSAELDKAVADFDAALSADRLYLDAYQERAKVWMYRNEHSKAIADLTQAIRLRKDDPRFYSARARAYKSAGDLDAAADDCTKAIRLGVRGPEHEYQARGEVWLAKKDYDQALADFDQAIRLWPEGEMARAKRREVWNAMGSFEKSIDDLRASVAATPRASSNHAELARLLISCPKPSCRDPQEAVKHAVTACQLTEEKDAELISLVAAANAAAGNFDDAVRWQKKAIAAAGTEEQRNQFRAKLDAYSRGESFTPGEANDR